MKVLTICVSLLCGTFFINAQAVYRTLAAPGLQSDFAQPGFFLYSYAFEEGARVTMRNGANNIVGQGRVLAPLRPIGNTMLLSPELAELLKVTEPTLIQVERIDSSSATIDETPFQEELPEPVEEIAQLEIPLESNFLSKSSDAYEILDDILLAETTESIPIPEPANEDLVPEIDVYDEVPVEGGDSQSDFAIPEVSEASSVEEALQGPDVFADTFLSVQNQPVEEFVIPEASEAPEEEIETIVPDVLADFPSNIRTPSDDDGIVDIPDVLESDVEEAPEEVALIVPDSLVIEEVPPVVDDFEVPGVITQEPDILPEIPEESFLVIPNQDIPESEPVEDYGNPELFTEQKFVEREGDYIQIGAFRDPAFAKSVLSSVSPHFEGMIVEKGNTQLVLVGPVIEDEKGLLLYTLRNSGYPDAFVRTSADILPLIQ